MNRSLLVLLLIFPVATAAQPASQLTPAVRQYVTVPEAVVALTNVRVVDGTGAPPRENVTTTLSESSVRVNTPLCGEIFLKSRHQIFDELFFPFGRNISSPADHLFNLAGPPGSIPLE